MQIRKQWAVTLVVLCTIFLGTACAKLGISGPPDSVMRGAVATEALPLPPPDKLDFSTKKLDAVATDAENGIEVRYAAAWTGVDRRTGVAAPVNGCNTFLRLKDGHWVYGEGCDGMTFALGLLDNAGNPAGETDLSGHYETDARLAHGTASNGMRMLSTIRCTMDLSFTASGANDGTYTCTGARVSRPSVTYSGKITLSEWTHAEQVLGRRNFGAGHAYSYIAADAAGHTHHGQFTVDNHGRLSIEGWNVVEGPGNTGDPLAFHKAGKAEAGTVTGTAPISAANDVQAPPAIVVPSVASADEIAKAKKAMADMLALSQAIDAYAMEHQGKHPDCGSVGNCLQVPLVPTFMAKLPDDPWGGTYYYTHMSNINGLPMYMLGVTRGGDAGIAGSDPEVSLKKYFSGPPVVVHGPNADIIFESGQFKQYWAEAPAPEGNSD